MTKEFYSLASELGGGKVLDIKMFQMDKKLGSGGFGEVWRATHIKTGKVVAIKKLSMSQLDEEDLEVYNREIEILGRCRYPFLLHLVGYTVRPPYCIVVPYIPHGSLYDYVHHGTKKKDLPPTNLTIIAMGIAYAMMRLHQMNIIHRDLKSPNVLLDNAYLPYVCDFGISKQVLNNNDELTRDCGTTNWMAPEQMLSHNYDNKVDVYSYGMVLYEMVTGFYPFEGRSLLEITLKLKNKKRPKLPEDGKNESIKELIKQCWEQNPKKRPSFKNIYQMFVDQKVMFDETNPKGIRSMIALIGSQEQYLESLLKGGPNV